MHTKEALLRSSDSFRGLDQYRQALNRVQSLGDFVLDVSKELLTYAESLSQDTCHADTANIEINVTESEATHLQRKARERKGKRILFFNSEDGMKLRFKYGMHIPEHMRGAALYCALCGNGRDGKRGGRTSDKCKKCRVPLRMRSRGTERKTCWEIWHETKRLEARKRPVVMKQRVTPEATAEVQPSIIDPGRPGGCGDGASVNEDSTGRQGYQLSAVLQRISSLGRGTLVRNAYRKPSMVVLPLTGRRQRNEKAAASIAEEPPRQRGRST